MTAPALDPDALVATRRAHQAAQEAVTSAEQALRAAIAAWVARQPRGHDVLPPLHQQQRLADDPAWVTASAAHDAAVTAEQAARAAHDAAWQGLTPRTLPPDALVAYLRAWGDVPAWEVTDALCTLAGSSTASEGERARARALVTDALETARAVARQRAAEPTADDVARALGTSRATLYRALARAGVRL